MSRISQEKKDLLENKLLDASIAFLKFNNWNLLVIGGISIEKRPPLKYNFKLTINFMGGELKRSKMGEKK